MTTTYKTVIAGPRQPRQQDAPLAPLSPQWAFVVQLRQGTALNTQRLQGRVEHICSGQAVLFHSLEEARAFMERILEAEEEKPP